MKLARRNGTADGDPDSYRPVDAFAVKYSRYLINYVLKVLVPTVPVRRGREFHCLTSESRAFCDYFRGRLLPSCSEKGQRLVTDT